MTRHRARIAALGWPQPPKAATAVLLACSANAQSVEAAGPPSQVNKLIVTFFSLLFAIVVLLLVIWRRLKPKTAMTRVYVAETAEKVHLDPNCGPLRDVRTFSFMMPTRADKAVF